MNWKPGDLPVVTSWRDDGKVPGPLLGWGLFLVCPAWAIAC